MVLFFLMCNLKKNKSENFIWEKISELRTNHVFLKIMFFLYDILFIHKT